MMVLLVNGLCFAQDSILNAISEANHEEEQEAVEIIFNEDILEQEGQGSALHPEVKEETEQYFQKQADFIDFEIVMLAILAVFIVALSVFVFFDRKKRKDVVIDILTNDKNYGEGHSLQHWLNYRVVKPIETALLSRSKTEMQELRNKIEDLNNRIAKIEEQSIERQTQPIIGIRSQIVDNISKFRGMPTAQPKKLYALNIIDGIFNKVSEQISGIPIFELTLSSPNSASFTVYKGAFSTVLAAPEYLEGCDKQTLSDTPHDLQIVEGNASLLDNGKWKIIQKATIKLV